MGEKKLTDEEIVKALENCANDEMCRECPYFINGIECGNQRSENDYLDLIHRLQDENKLMTEELKNLDWYKMWHKQFKKEIDDLTLELETYRPTKLSGNGQCKCSICGVVSWTNWFSRYKGQTLCNECLKELLEKENI